VKDKTLLLSSEERHELLDSLADLPHSHFLEHLVDEALLEDLETEEAGDGATDSEDNGVSGW